MYKGLVWLYFLAISLPGFAQEFTYYEVDNGKAKWGDFDQPDWLRYFGLDAGDINRDQRLDILSGRNVYLQPANISDSWVKLDLGLNVDGFLIIDVDDDQFADIIGMALPKIYWLEANADLTSWKWAQIAEIPATSHVNSQGFTKGDLSGDGHPEIIIAGDGDIYAIEIPEILMDSSWTVYKVGINTSDEGIGVGDLDGDGDLDLVAGRRPDGEDEPLIITWFENPGELKDDWSAVEIGNTNHPADRIGVADIDKDGKNDIVVAEERWPGKEPDGNIFWFKQIDLQQWERKHLVTQYSSNNLDLKDLDRDGDIDILTAEHKGPDLELQFWVNDGAGNFKKKIIDKGKENHLGVMSKDMDGDGDLDILGIGWDFHQYVHYWRNESK